METKVRAGMSILVVCLLVWALVSFYQPRTAASSDTGIALCLQAICVATGGTDKECIETQPRFSIMHIVETGNGQRAIFEVDDRECKGNDGNHQNTQRPVGK